MIPELLDVTLRDGGYVNDFAFPVEGARKLVAAVHQAGIPRLEVGYYRPRLAAELGAPGPKCCRPSYLEAVARAAPGAELFVMVHHHEVQLDDYLPLADRGIRGVRLTVSTDATTAAIERHVRAVRAARLLCSVNLIRMSQRTLDAMIVQARAFEDAGADWLYLADSNGSMFPDRVEAIFRAIRHEVGVTLGYHAHDSLRLAFANALAAVRGGATLLDSSLGGMGKGAGNLATEIIAGYLKSCLQVRYDLPRLVAVAGDVIGAWIARDHEKRCEAALSAFLDLNIDELKTVSDAARERQCSQLVELDRRIDQRLSTTRRRSPGRDLVEPVARTSPASTS